MTMGMSLITTIMVTTLLKRNVDLASALNQSDFAETFAQVVHSVCLLLLLLLPLLLLLLLYLPQELLLNVGDIREQEIGVSNCFSQLLPCFPLPKINIKKRAVKCQSCSNSIRMSLFLNFLDLSNALRSLVCWSRKTTTSYNSYTHTCIV